jgi:hypothetical protein
MGSTEQITLQLGGKCHCNVLTELVQPAHETETGLNEANSKVLISCSELSQTRPRIINIASQLSFRTCHQEGPRKPSGIEWNTSATTPLYLVWSWSKSKYMLTSRLQTAGENHYLKLCKRILWKCGKYCIFQNDSNKSQLYSREIESRVNLGKACWRAVQDLIFPTDTKQRDH